MKNLALLGSTGSIGRQSLEVVDSQNDINVVALSANSNVELLSEQARKYRPDVVCICNKDKYSELKLLLSDTNIRILSGEESLSEISTHPGADKVLTAVVGSVGLKSTVDAIESKKQILLANKETLVTGGEFIMPLAGKHGVDIIPVDSEHSAIFQSLKSGDNSEIAKLLITCSGGPFFGKTYEDLRAVKASDALKHPNWNMGAKITIDSATLMNKGLEVIEAKWLFGVDISDIEVYVHRQSIVHSMVEFCDGSVIAQMGIPNMKLPIQYAINYPKRYNRLDNRLNLFDVRTLTFEPADTDTFICLRLAIESAKQGGVMPTVLNASNEIAVAAFLNNKIGFCEIGEVVAECMSEFKNEHATLETVLKTDCEARIKTESIIERKLTC